MAEWTGAVPPTGAEIQAQQNCIKEGRERTHCPELLAPAGNYACFLAAVNAGADAVYLAGKQYGARAAADNFDEDELVSAIRYAHLFERRVYLTVNTLLKDDELEGLAAYLEPYVKAGLDAVIVQDLGVLSVIRREFPGLAVHCSTQMTITDEWGVRLAKELGAMRVVPAREMTLTEIRRMKQICPDMEIECFIHGAMCYCYSGQCLMSSLIGGRSGNRGACAQPCRLPYDVEWQEMPATGPLKQSDMTGARCSSHAGERGIYPLSLKDLCTVRMIPELIGAGIDSFKIEGRMKNPEYCAGVTAVYRAVIDRYFAEGEAAQGVTAEELELLSGLYIRSGIGEGYYRGQTGRQMLTPDKPGYRGCDESVLNMIRERYLERKLTIPVTMTLSLKVGEPACLVVRHFGEEVSCTGEIVQAAAKKPLTADDLKKRLAKTGNTPFSAEDIRILMTEPAFLPVGGVNELRRKALCLMEEALLVRYERQRRQMPKPVCGSEDADDRGSCHGKETPAGRAGQHSGYLAFTDQAEQIAVCEAHPLLQGICAPAEVYEAYWKKRYQGMTETVSENTWNGKRHYLCLPRILRYKDTGVLEEKIQTLIANKVPIDGIYVHTAGEYRYAVSLAGLFGKEPQEFLFGSPFLYCMNAESVKFWKKRMCGMSLPYELCEREIRTLLNRIREDGIAGLEMPVYGHIPMMVTANCIVGSFDRNKCPNAQKQIWLKDRTGKRMYVKTECGYCLNTIYNSVPLSMHKHMPKLQKLYENGLLSSFSLYFTMENAEQTKKVLDRYLYPDQGIWAPGSYTNGHFQRGVV